MTVPSFSPSGGPFCRWLIAGLECRHRTQADLRAYFVGLGKEATFEFAGHGFMSGYTPIRDFWLCKSKRISVRVLFCRGNGDHLESLEKDTRQQTE